MNSAIKNNFAPFTLPYEKSFSGSGDNNDSVTAWGDRVALTAKDNDRVVIFDRNTGAELSYFTVDSPNSIYYDSGQLFVTTKTGDRKIKVYDAETFNFLFEFAGQPYLQDGEHDLTIWHRPTDGKRIAFCSDDSGNVYGIDVDTDSLEYTIDTGISKGIEELQVIPRPGSSFDWLVIADENQDLNYAFLAVKLFHNGSYQTDGFYGLNLMLADSEGLSFDPASDGKTGYLISTDQQEPESVFHIWHYDDSGFELQGEFKIQGVGNTDGTFIEGGEFFALNDDQDVKSVSLANIYAAAGLGFSGGGDPDPDPTDCSAEITAALSTQKTDLQNQIALAIQSAQTARADAKSELEAAILNYYNKLDQADEVLNSALLQIFS